MADRQDGAEHQRGEEYSYFMIRIRSRHAEGAEPPSGVLERLGSGRKQPFEGAAELVRLLGEAHDTGSNMPTDPEDGNP